jgi:hypothetical protein
MLSIFHGANYTDDSLSDLENNARLALDLVIFLQRAQASPDGCWVGNHPGATLRQTTHALEALHLLDWKTTLSETLEAGAYWLINLSDMPELADEDGESVRRHPSRFKTLAWIDEFNDDVIHGEYEALWKSVSEDGILHGVLADSFLATMILVDSLGHIRDAAIRRKWQPIRNHCLGAIETRLQEWQRAYRERENSPGAAAQVAENNVSYGLDILLNEARIERDDPLAVDIRNYMLASINRTQHPSPLPTDTLYAALQLAAHFREDEETVAALETFFTYIRQKYTRQEFGRETASFHPLLLRVILTAYRAEIVPIMIRYMLSREHRELDNSQQATDRRHYKAFQQLILRRCQVDIAQATPLASGLTPADIFRVDYALTIQVYEDGQQTGMRLTAAPHSLVIKVGSHDALGLAAQRYRSLPEEIKPYFAKHASSHDIFSDEPSDPGYLVLEDLTDAFKTLSERLREFDRRRVTAQQREMIGELIGTVSDTLTDIYGQTLIARDSIVGFQTARLYLARLEEKLLECGQPEHFPVLKPWFRGFHRGDRRYPSVEYYLNQLDRYKEQLQVRHLMLIHGDCHSRNIMLDDNHHVKIIDIDKIDFYGDYIYDFAQLIEDIAVFQFLFMPDYLFRLPHESITFPNSGDEPGVIETAITYPSFSSEAVVHVQTLLCDRLEAFAGELGDTYWRERLWLATALHLIRLITKQQELPIAAVLYAEAMQLLEQLVDHLQGQQPLPPIPFPAARNDADDDSGQPFRRPEHASLATLHDAILALDPTTAAEIKQNGARVAYFVTGQKQPFAILEATRDGGRLLLACEVEAVQEILDGAKARPSQSPLRTEIGIPPPEMHSRVLQAISELF